jgi:hypothetical protein
MPVEKHYFRLWLKIEQLGVTIQSATILNSCHFTSAFFYFTSLQLFDNHLSHFLLRLHPGLMWRLWYAIHNNVNPPGLSL